MSTKAFCITIAIFTILIFAGNHYPAGNEFQGEAKPPRPRKKIDWYFNPSEHRGKNGQRFTYVCPAHGVAYILYGSDIYTDDSSVCTAAVHAGLITLELGGTVTIEIRPGQSSYQGSKRNGVGSLSYRSFSGSFSLEAEAQEIDWNFNPRELRGKNGQRVTNVCPAKGVPRTIYGSDVYTDDSSVCTAAVHAGLITFERGGTVTIEIRPGESSYQGSKRNGVSSQSYRAWSGSFVFVH